jgi:hypothetical protein
MPIKPYATLYTFEVNVASHANYFLNPAAATNATQLTLTMLPLTAEK